MNQCSLVTHGQKFSISMEIFKLEAGDQIIKVSLHQYANVHADTIKRAFILVSYDGIKPIYAVLCTLGQSMYSVYA